MPVTFDIDVRGIDKLSAETMLSLDRGVGAVALAIVAEAVKGAPIDTGSLRSSIKKRRVGPGQHMVESKVVSPEGAPYGAYQEFGTGNRHETWDGASAPQGTIYPTSKKFMKWSSGGQTVYRRSVEGVPATHYMKNAVDEVTPDIRRIFMVGFQQRI